jgi:hypothetical protein
MKTKTKLLILCLFSLATLRNANAQAPADIPPVSNKGLKYFGFAAIDDGRTNYAAEISGFANVGQMVVYSPDEALAKRIAAFDRAGVKAIVHIEPILFERGQAAAPSGAKACALRANAEARWGRFVNLNRDMLTLQHVAAVYVFDEPVWNGVSPADFTRALKMVKSLLPELPTAAIECWRVVNQVMVPTELDWISWDRYDVPDPESDQRWLADLKTVRAARTRPDQKIVIIANTHWKTYFKDAGVRPADMGAPAASSYRVAASDPDVVALIGYLWPGGIDPAHPGELGARDLPENVRQIYRQIGQRIIQKR